ncbi:hypothetical protein GCM10007385_10260 [Tateyamaria omphalii]|nr:hypothetical protein GCM10007385_10260 [Tateyamaria omphalii]
MQEEGRTHGAFAIRIDPVTRCTVALVERCTCAYVLSNRGQWCNAYKGEGGDEVFHGPSPVWYSTQDRGRLSLRRDLDQFFTESAKAELEMDIAK